MARAQEIPWKIGDDIDWDCAARNADTNAPEPMTGWSVASQVRDGETGTLIASLIVTWTNQANGEYNLKMATSGWPRKKLRWDIQYTDPAGVVASTETKILDMQDDVTEP